MNKVPTKEFWNARWQQQQTGWDIGHAAPALTRFTDAFSSKDGAVLIPGCGNAYEAQHMLDTGFTNLTLIDIAPVLVQRLQAQFRDKPQIQVICGDFFELQGRYDLILEQTFFCALTPDLRPHYVQKMHELLAPDGILTGLLFDRGFEQGPPFGGHKAEYERLFHPYFAILEMDTCLQSIEPRQGSELFFRVKKKR